MKLWWQKESDRYNLFKQTNDYLHKLELKYDNWISDELLGKDDDRENYACGIEQIYAMSIGWTK